MEQRFNDYIQNNRDQFDIEEPNSAKMWEVINNSHKAKKISLPVIIARVAAVAILLLGITGVVFNAQLLPANKYVLAKYDKQLGEREKEYVAQVKQKMKLIKSNKTDDTEIVVFLKNELSEIDTVYNKVVSNIGMSGNIESIANTIFDTYEKRLLIMGRIINEKQKQERDDRSLTIAMGTLTID